MPLVRCLAMKFFAALFLAACVTSADARCPDGSQLMFRCAIIERNAEVELCNFGGEIRYTYQSNDEIELQFIGEAWGGLKRQVKGIHGTAFASAVRRGDMYYAIFVDSDMMEMDTHGQSLGSPNPALLQVYASQKHFTDYENDEPIARRVCYPPSIQVDSSNFGPG